MFDNKNKQLFSKLNVITTMVKVLINCFILHVLLNNSSELFDKYN